MEYLCAFDEVHQVYWKYLVWSYGCGSGPKFLLDPPAAVLPREVSIYPLHRESCQCERFSLVVRSPRLKPDCFEDLLLLCAFRTRPYLLRLLPFTLRAHVDQRIERGA